jgi:hypothetical protein
VKLGYFNAQSQPKFVWPPSVALARAYVDQLERSGGLPSARIASARQALASAASASGGARRDGLTRLATELESEARGRDEAKVRMLVSAVHELARMDSNPR